jgi:hypothetical protein
LSNLDLNNLPDDLQATLTKKETDDERRVRLTKDLTVFFASVAVVAMAFVWAAWVAVSGYDPTQRTVAIPILTSIVGGLLGYMVKK